MGIGLGTYLALASVLFGIGALGFFAVAGLGVISLAVRNWVAPAALAAPLAILLAFLLVRGLTLSPRFFLLGLPLAVMAVAEGADLLGGMGGQLGRAWVMGRRLYWVFLMMIATLMCVSLPRYYSMPKQNFREPIARLIEMRDADAAGNSMETAAANAT